jgi:hypothetical protein
LTGNEEGCIILPWSVCPRTAKPIHNQDTNQKQARTSSSQSVVGHKYDQVYGRRVFSWMYIFEQVVYAWCPPKIPLSRI